MINRTSVFRKSIKGVEAIASRQLGMPRRMRSALIMIDGKRDVEELMKFVSTLGEPEEILAELESAGLIEMAEGIPVAPVPPAPASAVPKVVTPVSSGQSQLSPPTLTGARQFTSRLLLELLGPTAEALCLKIEAARDMPAFVAAVMRARDVLRDVKGNAAAAHFIEQVEAHTPGA